MEKREIRRYEELRLLQTDNYELNTLLLKMKAMNAWKINHETGVRVKLVSRRSLSPVASSCSVNMSCCCRCMYPVRPAPSYHVHAASTLAYRQSGHVTFPRRSLS